MAIGRMRPGVAISQVQSEMDTVMKQLEQSYPASNKSRGAIVVPLHDTIVEDLRPMVGALAGAVAFVLLIGCTNVAGLLMTRMVGRDKERAIRVALGAGRLRLISHVLSEAVLLSAAGGALGLAIAAWGVPPLARIVADYMPPGIKVAVDSRVLTFTFLLAIVSALLVAAVPAWQSSVRDALAATRGAGAKAGGNRARGLLVVGEVALALVLLAGAGLMLRADSRSATSIPASTRKTC
jgi:putative ABC transport system permease protein